MKWFLDKVLPALVISIIVYTAGQLSGLLSVGVSPAVQQFIQSWVPNKVILFSNQSCPDGWDYFGISEIQMRKIVNPDLVQHDKTGQQTGVVYAHYCVKK